MVPVVLILMLVVLVNNYLRSHQLRRQRSAESLAAERGRNLQEAHQQRRKLEVELTEVARPPHARSPHA